MRLLTLAIISLYISVTGTAHAEGMDADEPNHLPSNKPDLISAYGDNPLQIGELRLPVGVGPFPVVIVIHGGCWTEGLATTQHTAAMATALSKKGVATWNIEYRQFGDEGAGWPGSFLDWGMATDHLRTLSKTYPLDLANVVVTGHSAGAHAALFVAARPKLPEHSEVRGSDPLKVKAVVAIDGPGDIASFIGTDKKICGRPVIERFMGGKPNEVPKHYAQGSPVKLLPFDTEITLISASAVLSPTAAGVFRKAANAKGDKINVQVIAYSSHFESIAPGTAEWRKVEAQLLKHVGITVP